MKMLSRRDWMRLTCSLAGSLWATRGEARTRVAPGLSVELTKEFPHSKAIALSPDGTKLCLEDWKSPSYPTSIVEVGTWRTIYRATVEDPSSRRGQDALPRLPARIGLARFFADNQRLLWDIPPAAGEDRHRLTILDVATGERSERWAPLISVDRGTYDAFYPLEKRIVLVEHYEGRPRSETTTLALVDFSDNREIRKVLYATKARAPKLQAGTLELSGEYHFRLSDDLRVLAYSFDNVLVCRRTEDLEILWKKALKKS